MDLKITNEKGAGGVSESYIRAYWNDIQSGAAIVGYYVHRQMEMLMDDLENPELQIDLEESEKRIRFIERECRHSEAPFAGKPFILLPFQMAIVEAIFAIKLYDKELGRYVRKYQEVLLVVARKNGKTPLASAISLAEWVCGEMGTKILYGSNDYDQADLLYAATDAMREASPKLARCTRRNQKGIFFGGKRQKNHVGKFTAQNKGSIRKLSARTSAKEGRNIKVGIVDEVHELKDNTFIMPILQALSTQEEPLYIEITTEGFTDDGYLDARLKLAEAVLEGEIEKPNMLIFWYTQDSEEEIWRDEKSWYKSNPGMGAVKKWSFLRGMVEDAKSSASTKAFVLAKDFNIKQTSSAAWLSEDVLTNNATFDIEEMRGQVFIGGFDYAETTDLCNAKALFVNPWTMQKRTLSMYFIPETKADAILEDKNKLNPERKNYREWEKRGLVTICQGTEVNPADVVNWFISLTQILNVIPYKIGFDNWHAKGVKDLIIEAFDEKEILERIGMDFMSLNGAMSSLETDLMYKKINYNDNEVDRWCLRNTALKLNNMGLKMPVKLYNQSKNRIDGTLGFLISYAAYSRYSDTYLQYQKGRIPEGREWA